MCVCVCVCLHACVHVCLHVFLLSVCLCVCVSKETGEAVLMSFLAQIFRLDWTASI